MLHLSCTVPTLTYLASQPVKNNVPPNRESYLSDKTLNRDQPFSLDIAITPFPLFLPCSPVGSGGSGSLSLPKGHFGLRRGSGKERHTYIHIIYIMGSYLGNFSI